MTKGNFKVDKNILVSESRLEEIFDRLWPICRSITGNGFRESLSILSEVIPLQKNEVPSGTQVLDWTVPPEWNVEDAYVLDDLGNRVIDFKKNNLHLLGYSVPIDKTLTREELDAYLYDLPELPDAIPYLTSYYKERWGFCVSHNFRKQLKAGTYRAVIKSRLAPGHLTYGDLVLPSTQGSEQEIFVSSYLCHPSMANNELSGPITLAFLYDYLSKLPHRRFAYRFVIAPETIGAITYLSRWGDHLKKQCIAGFVLTSCGDPNGITYKRSRRGNSLADIGAEDAVRAHCRETGKQATYLDFFPSGSDERQYCSPGYNLPIGLLMRSWVGKYREYHTSLDNKQFITFSALQESIELYLKVFFAIENEATYQNLLPYGEPNLGKRGLYPTLGSQRGQAGVVKRIMYLLNYSDGSMPLSAIASKADCSISELSETAVELQAQGLLKDISTQP